jgi:hypothetical protein
VGLASDGSVSAPFHPVDGAEAGLDLGTSFDGDASYGAALLGYQFRKEAMIVKLFAWR